VPGQRFYVVWRGRKRGIFASWEECERQVKGYVGAQYKAFTSREEALDAYSRSYGEYQGRPASMGKWRSSRTRPIIPSISVDAACSGSPGRLQYRGVETETGKVLFDEGPFAEGTNNVGEFLAIAAALGWLKRQGLHWPVYSDSENAIGWILAGKARTKLRRSSVNRTLFEKIALAEASLVQTRSGTEVLKWNTAAWGEIPADYGRK
jgi:ribonuclease HI